jgi:CCR4-NOT transcription complex subunit 7/8
MSKFSAESPPFNPNAGISMGSIGSIGSIGSSGMYSSPNHSRNNSYTFGTATATATNTATTSIGTSNIHHYIPTAAAATTTTTTNSNVNGNSNAVMKYTFTAPDTKERLEIRNVWAENVEQEMANIREVVERYPYVAMDTEFPGIVAKPVITETYAQDYHYKSLKVNVDLLNIIQLGLSFADENGKFCPVCPCWQFNFLFNLDDDMFAQDSIDLLTKSGISFEDHKKRGIHPLVFGELLMVSGLVLDDRVKWVSFHSGYDYGYLLKLLTTVELPNDEKSFFDLLRIYFPTIYDIKYMTSILDGYHFMGGLQRLADDLKCQRLGTEHQAGSDSLLTMSSFFALVKAKFTNPTTSKTDLSKCTNELFGYGSNHTVRKMGGNTGVGANSNNNVRDISTGSVLSVGSND